MFSIVKPPGKAGVKASVDICSSKTISRIWPVTLSDWGRIPVATCVTPVDWSKNLISPSK